VLLDACPGAGRGPSPVIASAPSGDGLPPAREYGPFAVSACQLSGTVSAVLGWTPEQFWQATPAELAAIFVAFTGSDSGPGGLAPLGTQQLETLKEAFPDG